MFLETILALSHSTSVQLLLFDLKFLNILFFTFQERKADEIMSLKLMIRFISTCTCM